MFTATSLMLRVCRLRAEMSFASVDITFPSTNHHSSEHWNNTNLPPVLPHPTVLVGDNSHHLDLGYQEADLNGESLQEWALNSDYLLLHDAKQHGTFYSASWQSQRVEFKLAVVVYKCRQRTAPSYLASRQTLSLDVVCGQPHHHHWLSAVRGCLPSAIVLFLSPPHAFGTVCRRTSHLHPRCLFFAVV